MLCGTGAHGAYHAGVLRALQEAGVKIDVMAGQGVGAGSARARRRRRLGAFVGAVGYLAIEGCGRTLRLALADSRRGSGGPRAAGDVAHADRRAPRRPARVSRWLPARMLQVEAGAAMVSAFTAWLQTAFTDQLADHSAAGREPSPSVRHDRGSAIGGQLAGRAAGGRRARGGWW